MRSVRHAWLKERTPPAVWRAIRSAHGFAVREPAWRYGRKARLSRRRMATFRDRHRGERCVIVGNGPSLARTDLDRLKGEVTFGLNRIYLLSERRGFTPSYHVCVNHLVLEQFGAEIAALPVPKFLSWDGRHAAPFDESVVLLRSHQTPGFAEDPARGLWEGCTVTYVALQLAFFMGFTTVILIGVDHRFATTGPANSVVVAEADDPNHFDRSYFGPGTRWQLPDLDASETAYRLAKARFERDGRRVIDATIDGALRVFERASFDDLFPSERRSALHDVPA